MSQYKIHRQDTGETKRFESYDEFHSIKSLLNQNGVDFEAEEP
jgi:hypothetical protein